MPTAKPRSTATSLRVPTPSTLRKYGLTVDDWLELCYRCKYECAVCGQPFGDRPLVIDHEHVKGWRAHKTRKGRRVRTMTPEERKQFVRGVLHSYCNRFVRAWLTRDRIARMKAYLDDYHRRKETA